MSENMVEFLKMEGKGAMRGIQNLRWIRIVFGELVGCVRLVLWGLVRVSMMCREVIETGQIRKMIRRRNLENRERGDGVSMTLLVLGLRGLPIGRRI
jgi:hypothetical protein